MSEFLRKLYDIRVKPEAKAAPAKGEKACAWPGCGATGSYRAPKSPTQLSEHQWFCIDHIRQYNSKWDFFSGMSMPDIERAQSQAATWNRPTWTVGVNPTRRGKSAGPSMAQPFDPRLIDPIGILDDGPLALNGRRIKRDPAQRQLSAALRASLAALDLDSTVGLKEIKARYKQLVKRYHPDANGGDQGAEDRLKRVIQAYRHLVASGLFR